MAEHSLGLCFDPAGHCITCGDDGVSVRVLEVDAVRELALCSDEQGTHTTVEVALVGAVSSGDRLLVHAGTAIARVEETAA